MAMNNEQKIAGEAAQKLVKKGARKGPSLVKEIVYGISLGLFAGYLWKMHHWNNQRRTKQFYRMLDDGLITVVLDDQHDQQPD